MERYKKNVSRKSMITLTGHHEKSIQTIEQELYRLV